MSQSRSNVALPMAFLALTACSGSDAPAAPPAPPPPTNIAPAVSAGPDQTVSEMNLVTLAGTVTDPDDVPAVRWTQLSGPAITLSDTTSLTPEFTAPMVPAPMSLEFQLSADDGSNPAVSDTVTVTITDSGVTVSSISPAGSSYIDPEIHPLRPELVFQENGDVWVGAIDPTTGRFVSDTGMDTFVDDTVSLTVSRNGPEYGLDTNGIAIFYNSEASDGSAQFSRATELGPGSYVTEQLTPNGNDRINQLPSQDDTSLTTFLTYGREATVPGVPVATGFISYLDEASPADDRDATELRPGFAGFRWLKGATFFTTTIAEDGPDQGQILLVNAATGEERVITDDAGIKFDPFPWFAPEFGGAIAVHATVNETDLAIYVDRGGPLFERIATLTPPAETDLKYVQSAEPFVSEGGISYITLTLKDDPGSVFTDVSDSEIWIYGIDDGPNRFTLDCGDGQPDKVRHEAESVSGTDQILVYYNEILPSGLFDLILCETGLAP
ncbi:MAG: hypothetical protein AAF292_10245 [Pseudomonadota bacterium]